MALPHVDDKRTGSLLSWIDPRTSLTRAGIRLPCLSSNPRVPRCGGFFFLKICRRTDSQIARYESCNRPEYVEQPDDAPEHRDSAAAATAHPRLPTAMASNSSAPTGATDAVLKPSEPVPEGAQEVQGIDFNQYASRSITVEELVGGYANMGFQATSVGEAVRIINDMVSCFCPEYPNARAAPLRRVSVKCGDSTCVCRESPVRAQSRKAKHLA